MKTAFLNFEKNLSNTKNITSLYSYIHSIVKPPMDYSDLLRWQWVQSLSSLDKLVHDLILRGMLEIYQSRRTATQKFNKFNIPLEISNEIKRNPLIETDLIEKQIIITNGFKSFQEPENIADGLSYIWSENHKWDKISLEMSETTHHVKTFLKNVAIRRNQIVHEGDYPYNSYQRQSVLEEDINDILSFISKLGRAIYDLVK
ncbi:HEPN domain-containing protein [Leptospira stimsonii]|uniref:RiboL-PSP-HEPN domain-containing protein n=1 Tax=Leptospira stimsonii TaxID=2202203 RepID=A0A396Z772_9LEPT|nr:HEPN domain-containing protein [Leptospira stimsonii]RHX89437.1 hypothetical protein DLM75_16580 [Leptospira stimsonii]